jgi:hypothetical protein
MNGIAGAAATAAVADAHAGSDDEERLAAVAATRDAAEAPKRCSRNIFALSLSLFVSLDLSFAVVAQCNLW